MWLLLNITRHHQRTGRYLSFLTLKKKEQKSTTHRLSINFNCHSNRCLSMILQTEKKTKSNKEQPSSLLCPPIINHLNVAVIEYSLSLGFCPEASCYLWTNMKIVLHLWWVDISWFIACVMVNCCVVCQLQCDKFPCCFLLWFGCVIFYWTRTVLWGLLFSGILLFVLFRLQLCDSQTHLNNVGTYFSWPKGLDVNLKSRCLTVLKVTGDSVEREPKVSEMYVCKTNSPNTSAGPSRARWGTTRREGGEKWENTHINI